MLVSSIMSLSFTRSSRYLSVLVIPETAPPPLLRLAPTKDETVPTPAPCKKRKGQGTPSFLRRSPSRYTFSPRPGHPATTMISAPEARLIKALSARRRPRILYHYTSGSGLIGILGSRSIWATDVRFLNDSSEYSFALGLARDEIEGNLAKARNKFDLALYTVLAERLKTDTAAEVCVTSFTENADQLSQWRAYCPPNGGYAIGFAGKSLVQSKESNPDRFLVRCVYDALTQGSLIRGLVQDVAAFAEENAHGVETHDRVFRESFKLFGRLITLIAPVLKHHSFTEEQEWRLVLLPSSFENDPLEFRQGRSMLVPYHKYPFPNETGLAPVEELVVGPTPHPPLARDAARALLSSCGLPSVTVRSSLIPYRAW